MAFEVVKYLESLGIDYVSSGPNVRRDNVAIHCIFCGERDPSYHLGINYLRDFYYCWICGRSGNYVSLVKYIEGISWIEARERVSAPIISSEDEEGIVTEELKPDIITEPDVVYELISMPEEAEKIVTGRESVGVSKFLRRRHLDIDTVLKYNLHFCQSGYYKQRVIIPIYNEYNDLIAFGARAMRDDILPKYFYPKGWPASRYLFGINHLNQEGLLVLVEGVFDAMRLDGIGVASFTHRISNEQISKLLVWYKLGLFKKLVVAFDGDSYDKSEEVAERMVGILPDVNCIELPYGEDPDSLGKEKVLELCQNLWGDS